ncbi:hypothetical protein HMPREF0724_14045 [Prescottella equi ATCC 33707]|uniref:Uncharacterized protein n=1 Tax=Prescottella equi ATCC 33707 TaxID=525370 RepID=F1TJZ2_RHOHA|nr:hypothetical protein HMPREF0724_14045 [Prescottella equi ATCC 33707]
MFPDRIRTRLVKGALPAPTGSRTPLHRGARRLDSKVRHTRGG